MRAVEGVAAVSIAQEVHDVVGHRLAAIKMQSDVALHVMVREPDQAASALQAISRTSKDALEELRATLAAVRRTGAGAASPAVAGLARLEELRQPMNDAGVHLDVEIVGRPRPLPAGVDLAGYRVVQESLTNVLKHGEGRVAAVRVEYGAHALGITVSNPAPQASTAGNGLGIPGMRSRVAALDGSFTAGPTDDGHFEVRASIPTGP